MSPRSGIRHQTTWNRITAEHGLSNSVGADLWSAVLDFRPARVIGEGCCCEEGIGEPYLLAWRNGDEFMLRELTDEEARKLQELRLASQAEDAARQERPISHATPKAQLGLF